MPYFQNNARWKHCKMIVHLFSHICTRTHTHARRTYIDSNEFRCSLIYTYNNLFVKMFINHRAFVCMCVFWTFFQFLVYTFVAFGRLLVCCCAHFWRRLFDHIFFVVVPLFLFIFLFSFTTHKVLMFFSFYFAVYWMILNFRP